MEEFRRFLAVAQARSISKAAEALHLSQPALSRSIALLEDRFKAALFARTPGGMQMTAAGLTLHEYASRALRAISDAEEDINHAQRNQKLTIAIGAGDSWGYGILPRFVREFGRSHPDVAMRIDVVDNAARMEGLRTGLYDVLFGVVSPQYEVAVTHTFIPLVSARYDVYCSTGHPLLDRESVTESDLRSYPWINHKFEYDFDSDRLKQTDRNYTIRTNTMLNTIEIMRASPMLISTSKTFREIFARNGIVRLAEDDLSRLFVSGLLYANRPGLRPVAREFVRTVVDHFRRRARQTDPVILQIEDEPEADMSGAGVG